MSASALLQAMEAPPPAFGETAAAAAVARCYGLEGRCLRLAGERDLNFRLTLPGGERRLLKIWNHQLAAEVIDLQIQVLQHLARADASVPVPRVQPDPEGRPIVEVEAPDGRMHRACLLSWLDGVFVREVPRTDGLRERLGHWLGRMDRALAGFSHPAMQRDMIWDVSRSERLESLLGAVREPRWRELAQDALRLFDQRVSPSLAFVPRQLLHGDFNLDNVLATHDGADVCGIIDFGDTLAAPRICELGIACAYLLDDRDPVAALAPLVRGYHAVFPLSREELELLPGLIRARLTASIVITSRMAELHPENRDYLLIDNAAAARGLERLEGQDPRLEARRLMEACGLG